VPPLIGREHATVQVGGEAYDVACAQLSGPLAASANWLAGQMQAMDVLVDDDPLVEQRANLLVGQQARRRAGWRRLGGEGRGKGPRPSLGGRVRL
jgi:hypothetical protein